MNIPSMRRRLFDLSRGENEVGKSRELELLTGHSENTHEKRPGEVIRILEDLNHREIFLDCILHVR